LKPFNRKKNLIYLNEGPPSKEKPKQNLSKTNPTAISAQIRRNHDNFNIYLSFLFSSNPTYWEKKWFFDFFLVKI